MRLFFLLLAVPSFFFANSVRHVYLTWQRENISDNITLNIHTTNNISELDIFYDSESKNSSTTPYKHHIHVKGEYFLKDRYLYHVEIQKLSPGKVYYFIVGSQKDGFTSEKKFKTIPSDFESLRLIEGGDWELPDEANMISKTAASYNPSAILLGGDYSSEVLSLDDYKKWDDWLDSYSNNMLTDDGLLIPLILAIGNHDVEGSFNKTSKDAPFFFRYFHQSKEDNKSYFLKLLGPDIALFVLDSGHCADYWGKQYTWLKKKLKKHKHTPVKLALYHVPIFPSVRFSNENWFYRLLYPLAKLSNKKIDFTMLVCSQSYFGKKYWLPLFDKYKLTTAFEHHDHTLKRTKPIRYGMVNPRGTVYLGDGGWSPNIQCAPIQVYLSRYFAKSCGYIQFFWVVDVSKDKITYRAISSNNQVIDEYTQKIRKE